MNIMQFKNNLSSDFGLIVKDLGRRSKPEEQIDIYEMPYANDDLIIHNGKYKPYLRDMEFVAKDMANIPLINQWLDGRGILKTSVDNNGFFYASVINSIPYNSATKKLDSLKVTFKVSPFFYLDSGNTTITLTSSQSFTNIGTIYSEPYIKVTGSGNITLTINSTIITLTGVSSYIEIDSELKNVYKDTINQGDKMSGEFPILQVGTNNISFTGTVTKIEIIPRWRQL